MNNKNIVINTKSGKTMVFDCENFYFEILNGLIKIKHINEYSTYFAIPIENLDYIIIEEVNNE